jgi:hypothetical protein
MQVEWILTQTLGNTTVYQVSKAFFPSKAQAKTQIHPCYLSTAMVILFYTGPLFHVAEVPSYMWSLSKEEGGRFPHPLSTSFWPKTLYPFPMWLLKFKYLDPHSWEIFPREVQLQALNPSSFWASLSLAHEDFSYLLVASTVCFKGLCYSILGISRYFLGNQEMFQFAWNLKSFLFPLLSFTLALPLLGWCFVLFFK